MAPEEDLPPPSDEDLLEPASHRFWFVLLACALLAGVGYAGYRVLSPVIRTGHSNRLAAEANSLTEASKFSEAARKAQDALDMRMFNPEAWRAVARVHSRAGNGPLALAWWRKVMEVRPLPPEDRRDYAAAALAAGDMDLAASEIAALREKSGTPADILLSARLAEARGDSIQSLHFLGRVLTDPAASVRDRLGAARAALHARRRDEPLLRVARTAVEELALFGGKSDSLPAMRLLAEFMAAGRGEPQITVSAPAPRVTRPKLVELIKTHPDVDIPELLSAWNLQLAEAKGLEAREVIFSEVAARARTTQDLTALSLTADWLLSHGELGRAFALATAEVSARSAHLANIRLDALSRLGRWRDALELLESNTLPLEDWFKEMRAAQAYDMTGVAVATQQRWTKAIRLCGSDLGKLLQVARFAAGIGATRASVEASQAILKVSPGHRVAHELAIVAADRLGGTPAVLEHLRLVRGYWPDDTDLEVREIYLGLLCGEDPSPLVDRAATLLRLRPENPDRRAAYALALYRFGRFSEAMTAVTERAFLREAENSTLLIVRAAILRANGFGLEAEKLAGQIPKASLRAEEMALLSQS